MILFTTIDNINLENRIHFPHGLKVEPYEHTPLATSLHNELKQGLGGHYMVNLRRPNRVIAFQEFDAEPGSEKLYSIVTYITYFFSFAWFLKFNTFQIGDIWFFDSNKRTLRQLAFGHNVVEPNGMKGIATFLSNSDVDAVDILIEKFLSFNFKTKFEMNLGATEHSTLSVLQRAAELIELSKLAPNTYHKIGLLCSSLECLFTTDNSEVTHKVCERVAFFLSDDPTERLEIYQKIKKAYDHRSSFFHGNKLKKLPNEAFFTIDEIVRQAVLKAVTEKSSIFLDEKNLPGYLLGLTFGTKTN